MSSLEDDIRVGMSRSKPSDRLADRVVIVVGAGQLAGPTTGNGKAAALVYAKEGATVLAADIDIAAANDTSKEIVAMGGISDSFQVDVTDESAVAAMVRKCVDNWGRVDVLHNNVGVSTALGDTSVLEITPEIFDRITSINLKGMILAAKHTLPIMRQQHSGVIINISSCAAIQNVSTKIAYKTSKAGVIALTQNLAITNAEFNIRANVIIPGQINTPRSMGPRIAQSGQTADEILAKRGALIPLDNKVGTAWDVAYASLFLASDEARFITGASLVVDGGQSMRIG